MTDDPRIRALEEELARLREELADAFGMLSEVKKERDLLEQRIRDVILTLGGVP